MINPDGFYPTKSSWTTRELKEIVKMAVAELQYRGIITTVEQVNKQPFAIGNYKTEVSFREKLERHL